MDNNPNGDSKPADSKAPATNVSPKRVPHPLRSFLRFLLLYVMIPSLAIIGFFGAMQRSLIYYPTKSGPLRAKTASLPDAKIEDVEISIDEKLTLHGWWYHSPESGADDRRFLVIYFGGNAGNRAYRVDDCRDFTPLGCDVLLVDYRGYGENGGTPTEVHLAADARRVWTFAHEKLNFTSKRIVLFGESLGGGVAVRLAAEQSKAGDAPAALILNSTFSSLTDTAGWHYPFLPISILLLDRYPSIERIPDVTCPLLQFHGEEDRIIPYEQGQRLFLAAPKFSANGIPKQFITIPRADHNMISVAQMQSTLKKLLGRIP